MYRFFSLALLVFAALAVTGAGVHGAAPSQIRVGSKKFTESVILGELAARLAASTGSVVVRRQELGGTRLLWDALLADEIDAYPEYTGTLTDEILAREPLKDEDSLVKALAERGLRISTSLGFTNKYALATLSRGEHVDVARISDLPRYPALRFGFSDEFLNRADGWPLLRAAYGLPETNVRGLDHDIAYKGLVGGSLDVIDVYTTDPEIAHYGLKLLEDDRRQFRDNKAVLLYRADLEQRAPHALAAMLRLQGAIDGSRMIAMNDAVRFGRRSEADVASQFLAESFGLAETQRHQGLVGRILQRTGEHIRLTIFSLSAAILSALPLGIVAARRPVLGQIILASVSILQTVPSLALLVFLIPILGLGEPTAIAALFLYSLLPIVRNTASGLLTIPAPIHSSAIALGLTPMRRLMLVELPMASPAILAGMKTAAVINVGTATLGALIGAGGYGQPILAGIRLDDFGLILEGAVPAAVLALAVQAAFEFAERRLVPRGLRLKRQD